MRVSLQALWAWCPRNIRLDQHQAGGITTAVDMVPRVLIDLTDNTTATTPNEEAAEKGQRN